MLFSIKTSNPGRVEGAWKKANYRQILDLFLTKKYSNCFDLSIFLNLRRKLPLPSTLFSLWNVETEKK